MKQHLALLGFKVKDSVTGMEGVVESIGFDLYGCIQAVVKPSVNEKGEMQDGRWFDIKRLTAISDTPVMPVPDFHTMPAVKPHSPAPKVVRGPAEKPVR